MLLHFLWNLFAFIIALSVLVIVHESGHFLVARFCKVKVERFAIGFGPILWRWRDSNHTEYVISIILFGGYVKLFNTKECISDRSNERNYAFNCKHFWQKVIIILSGSIFNFIFSIFLYTLVYTIGVPINKPVVRAVIPNSFISQSGIIPGMEIKSVNNVQTYDWESVRIQILNNIGNKKIIISTQLDGDIHLNTHTIYLPENWFNTYVNDSQDPIVGLGMLPDNIRIIPIISNIVPNSIAANSGLKVGDKIFSVNDKLVEDWDSFIINIKNCKEGDCRILVERKDKILLFCIKLDTRYVINTNVINKVIGISPKIIVVPKEQYKVCQYRLHNAIFQACNKTWEVMSVIIRMLIYLISGDVKAINIGGPISIAQGAGAAAHFGFVYYLMFLAIISINLGIVNLLPLPVLDGGYLLFLFLEKINGKAISQKIQNLGYIIGFTLIILVLCFACFYDISKLRS